MIIYRLKKDLLGYKKGLIAIKTNEQGYIMKTFDATSSRMGLPKYAVEENSDYFEPIDWICSAKVSYNNISLPVSLVKKIIKEHEDMDMTFTKFFNLDDKSLISVGLEQFKKVLTDFTIKTIISFSNRKKK